MTKPRGMALVGMAAVAVLVIVAVVVASASARRSGPPYGSTSTEPDGAAGLVELLRRFDTDVNIRDGMAGEGDGVALVLQSPLNEVDVDAMVDFAREGNLVVVADPFGPLLAELGLAEAEAVGPGAAGTASVAELLLARGDCTLPLEGVGAVRGFSTTFPSSEGTDICFASAGRAALVAQEIGRGTVIAIGGPDPFSNAYLARADNAVLATSLLTGRGPVAFVEPGIPGAGRYGLGRLVTLLPDWFWRLSAGLAVASALTVWASARRLGRPVSEPALLDLPATGFTDGVANLYHRAHAPALAAHWLRVRAHRQVAQRVGLPTTAPSQEVTLALAAARRDAGLEASTAAIGELLAAGPIADGPALVRLAHGLDALRAGGETVPINASTGSGARPHVNLAAGSTEVPSTQVPAREVTSPDPQHRGPFSAEGPGVLPRPPRSRSAAGRRGRRGSNESSSSEVPHGSR